LFIAERPYLLGHDIDGANQLIVLEHWNGKDAAITRELGRVEDEGIALDVRLRRRYVGDVRCLFGSRDPTKGHVRWWSNERLTGKRLNVFGRSIVGCDRAEAIRVSHEQCAELRLAEAHCVSENGIEHRLELTR